MVQKLFNLKESPSQTAGPYVHIGCTPNFSGIEGVFETDLGSRMKTGPVKGEEIVVAGSVFDGTGAMLRDAVVEIWQADAEGRFAGRGGTDPNFTGFGRSPIDAESGRFRFETVRPGRVAWHDGRLQAPHITVWIVARGINVGLHTRLYFADEEEANASDPVLGRIEDQRRVETLMAQPEDGVFRFDIRLQGAGETVFFDI